MRTVPPPEAMGKRLKGRLEDRLYDHHHRSLDNLVLEARLAYWPLLPPFLLNPDPLDRRRHIPIGAQPLMQVSEILVEVFGVLLGRHLVHPWRTVLPGAAIRFPQEGAVDQVEDVVEHHLRIASRLFCNALEFHGYGW